MRTVNEDKQQQRWTYGMREVYALDILFTKDKAGYVNNDLITKYK